MFFFPHVHFHLYDVLADGSWLNVNAWLLIQLFAGSVQVRNLPDASFLQDQFKFDDKAGENVYINI